jgi:tripartite-type tricarboxylate transporter receptor subunit TctC
MGRALYLPPGTPPDRVAALSRAFEDTMTDPAYIRQAKDRQLDAETWQRGPAIAALVDHAFALPPALRAKAKAAIDMPTP